MFTSWLSVILGQRKHRSCKTASVYRLRCVVKGMGGAEGARHTGAQAWRCYNTSALDFNIFFCARNSRALAAALAPEEAEAINVTWEAPRDDLKAYFTTHMKYMRVRRRAPAAWAGVW